MSEPEQIDVIAVDVAKSEKSTRSSKSSRTSHSRSRSHVDSREREVYIERERIVPVPVRVQPEFETFRYVDAPRRWSPPSPPRREVSQERERIIVEDHRRTREYYGGSGR